VSVLDFFRLAQDYPTKRKILLERVKKVLAVCRKQEECTLRLLKVLLEFIEKDPEENLRIVVSITNSIPSEYVDSVMRLVEAFSVDGKAVGRLGIEDSGLNRVLDGSVSCTDLENVPYLLEETKDFMVVALVLAILERAGELKDCGKTLARSLLSLTRVLYERGYGDLATSILKKHSVKIFVHRLGGEIKGIRVAIGSNIMIDLTDMMSLVYQDINAILELGNSSNKSV
jgi:hypothetical protein